ncbi:uncharacterized protein LOC143177346 [Calliopsis andreniformis]|uniref:uncharacterized protein LOC143177346 n=1 Tax=Calliopsis andreniformis TaxID=337506 RepID=UPI003FCE8546
MTGKIEYLEKYSVAPSPSRDYYGLRVLRDQVILYLWKISHGPHKTPIVRSSSFDDFSHDKLLQDEIQRIFGDFLLKHVRNIASGRRNTLLTLPRNLIENLVKYLTVNDIAKLSSLSHAANEVFNANFVWETLYKKYKPLRRSQYERLYTSHNWKQLVQQAKIEGLMNDQRVLWSLFCFKSTFFKNSKKVSRARLAPKQTKATPKLEDSTKTSSGTSRGALKPVPPVNQLSKKPSENIRKKPTQNPVSKKVSDPRLERIMVENEKMNLEKKVPLIKSLQTAGQKNLKTMKDQMKVTKNEPKREIETKDSFLNKTVETKSSKTQIKVRRTDSKVNSTSTRMVEEKSISMKLRNPSMQRSVEKQRTERLPSSMHEQTKPKMKGKTKKVGQSKSTILSTNSAVMADHLAIRDDSFDLADLIEASLKNIRSPRSIFDYNFSCIEKSKSCAGDSKMQEEYRKIMESTRVKSGRIRTPLDRLSEKSEPLTAKSTKSVKSPAATNRSDVSAASAPKFVKTPKSKAKIAADLMKNPFKIPVPEDKVDTLERYGIYNKFPTPRLDAEQKRLSPQKMDKMNLLRSLGPNDPYSRMVTGGRAGDTNRYQLRKAVGSFYKH